MKHRQLKPLIYALIAFIAVCLADACKKSDFPHKNTISPADSAAADSIAALDSLPSFNQPSGIAADAAGNLYVADYGNNLIRKITPQGVVTTFAGSGYQGHIDASGVLASFNKPTGIAIDASGNLYIADSGNDLVRKISSAGAVTTIAGTDSAGYADGAGAAASFFSPLAVAVNSNGNIYVADAGNNLIRLITPGGNVSTFAGTYNTPSSMQISPFNNPSGIALDASGNIFVANYLDHNILEVNTQDSISTYAGSGLPGAANGAADAATFYFPNSVATDAAGDVYVSDGVNNLIRKITPDGIVSTLAGSGSAGAADSTGIAASFNDPAGLAVDAAGNVYVADAGNNLIRKITATGVVTTVAGSGRQGAKNGIAVFYRRATTSGAKQKSVPTLFSPRVFHE